MKIKNNRNQTPTIPQFSSFERTTRWQLPTANLWRLLLQNVEWVKNVNKVQGGFTIRVRLEAQKSSIGGGMNGNPCG